MVVQSKAAEAAAEAPDTEESNESESTRLIDVPTDVTYVLSEAAALSNIDIGDSLPSYTLKNEKGEDVDVATLAAEKGVIFFLVPKADTRESSLSRPLAALVSH